MMVSLVMLMGIIFLKNIRLMYMPIPNYKKFLLEDPLADSDSSDSDYDPNSEEEEEMKKIENK